MRSTRAAARLASWTMVAHSVRLLLDVIRVGRFSYRPAINSYRAGPKPGSVGRYPSSSRTNTSQASSGRRTRCRPALVSARPRSEEHTSELQSRVDLVCRLLLEKKKNLS